MGSSEGTSFKSKERHRRSVESLPDRLDESAEHLRDIGFHELAEALERTAEDVRSKGAGADA